MSARLEIVKQLVRAHEAIEELRDALTRARVETQRNGRGEGLAALELRIEEMRTLAFRDDIEVPLVNALAIAASLASLEVT